MTNTILLKDGWIICGKCGHKLARSIGGVEAGTIEFKCSSCKEVNLYQYSDIKEQKTNRDWLNSLSNEEWLSQIIRFCNVADEVCKICAYQYNNNCSKRYYIKNDENICRANCSNGILTWLKAKHNGDKKGE